MASVSVYNKEGKEVEKIDLNDSVFAAPVNEHLVHMAVVLQLANKRQGTQKAFANAINLGTFFGFCKTANNDINGLYRFT